MQCKEYGNSPFIQNLCPRIELSYIFTIVPFFFLAVNYFLQQILTFSHTQKHTKTRKNKNFTPFFSVGKFSYTVIYFLIKSNGILLVIGAQKVHKSDICNPIHYLLIALLPLRGISLGA
jgi:hypothetical protein